MASAILAIFNNTACCA